MQSVLSSEYYNKVRKFMEENPDASDERVYCYLLSLAPMRGDEYGVPEFSSNELDHIQVHDDKLVFHHRGITGAVRYDGSFVLKPGNKKFGCWLGSRKDS